MGDSVFHWAAAKGHLSQIPANLLTYENFILRNDQMVTVFHRAAKHGHLNQIPEQLLSLANLQIPNKNGRTSIHLAAKYGHLDQIPQEFVTFETLAYKDGGLCPIRDIDQILGVNLPESVRIYVGVEWYNKNLEFIELKKTPMTTEPEAELEIF